MNKQTHLKCISNGRVFIRTDNLAARGDMVPCNAEGQIAQGHIGDADAVEAGQSRRKTRYLGNLKNGVLYPYTDILATRDDMISIDTEEQWNLMKSTGEAPEIAENTVVPTLQRSVNAPPIEPENAPVIPDPVPTISSDQGSGEFALPVIEGMGAREAKTVLSDWAKEKFNAELDRRVALPEFIKECELLAANAGNKAVGQ